MPHSSHGSRYIWTLSSLRLTLKWSGSWTWWSSKVPSDWPILRYCRRLLWKKITFFHPWFTNLSIISLFHLFRITVYIRILKSWNLGIKKWNFNSLSAMESTPFLPCLLCAEPPRWKRLQCFSCICAVVQETPAHQHQYCFVLHRFICSCAIDFLLPLESFYGHTHFCRDAQIVYELSGVNFAWLTYHLGGRCRSLFTLPLDSSKKLLFNKLS